METNEDIRIKLIHFAWSSCGLQMRVYKTVIENKRYTRFQVGVRIHCSWEKKPTSTKKKMERPIILTTEEAIHWLISCNWLWFMLSRGLSTCSLPGVIKVSKKNISPIFRTDNNLNQMKIKIVNKWMNGKWMIEWIKLNTFIYVIHFRSFQYSESVTFVHGSRNCILQRF